MIFKDKIYDCNICDTLLLFLGQIYENVCRKSKRCFKHSGRIVYTKFLREFAYFRDLLYLVSRDNILPSFDIDLHGPRP